MIDISRTVLPRSDQLNADSLLGGPITICITQVRELDADDQPIAIHYAGDDGKPYKPNLSMRRVMLLLWEKNAENYSGRWLTLYRDPDVRFGKDKVGGICISHMSDIGRDQEVLITAKRSAKKIVKIRLLQPPQGGGNQRQGNADETQARQWQGGYIDALNNAETLDDLADIQQRGAQGLARLKGGFPALHEDAVKAGTDAYARLSGGDDDQGGDDDDRFPGDDA